MQHSVDNQEIKEFFWSSVKIFSFFLDNTLAKQNFTGIFSKGKGEHIRRLILAPKFFIINTGF
jgi:hypothetical protein